MAAFHSKYSFFVLAVLSGAPALASSLTYSGALTSGNADNNGPTISSYTPFTIGASTFEVDLVGLFAGGVYGGSSETLQVGIYADNSGVNGSALATQSISYTDSGEQEFLVTLTTPLQLAANTKYWLGVSNIGSNNANWYRTVDAGDFSSNDATVAMTSRYYVGQSFIFSQSHAAAFELNPQFASATPEPAALGLAGLGLAAMLAMRPRWRS